MSSADRPISSPPPGDPEPERLVTLPGAEILRGEFLLDLHFKDRLQQAVAQAQRTRERVAVHVLEIDGGDQMPWAVEEVAGRIGALIRESDAWVRLDTGRFAVLQRAIRQVEGALFLARRLLTSATAPIARGEHTVRFEATVGLCFHIPDIGPEALLAQAEMARQQARRDGNRVSCWQSAVFDTISPVQRQEMLAGALRGEEIFLEYQPQVDLSSGCLSGFEALARWRHPTLGTLTPEAFIPWAEHSGLIFELGEIVLRDACQRCCQWNSPAAPETPVAVNVSPIQLLGEGFVEQVERVLAQSGLEARLLELELTETASINDEEKTRTTLHDLKTLGVRLALDDFGTGYNSLSYLHDLPIDRIKTPREFLEKTSSEARCSLVSIVTLIGQQLGIQVVAEGVETQAQLRTVRDAGCQFAQGFLWGPPAVETPLMARPAEERLRPLRPSDPEAV